MKINARRLLGASELGRRLQVCKGAQIAFFVFCVRAAARIKMARLRTLDRDKADPGGQGHGRKKQSCESDSDINAFTAAATARAATARAAMKIKAEAAQAAIAKAAIQVNADF